MSIPDFRGLVKMLMWGEEGNEVSLLIGKRLHCREAYLFLENQELTTALGMRLTLGREGTSGAWEVDLISVFCA